MNIPNGAIVAVVDGQKLNLFHNKGDEQHPTLAAMPAANIDTENHGSGGRHHTSAANPDHGLLAEDSHSAGVATMLNAEVEAGRIKHLIVVAAPRALGELRKHFSKRLSAVLVGEIAKDLTGHSVQEVEKTIAAV